MLNFKRILDDILALMLLGVISFITISLVSYSPADPPSQLVFPPNPVAKNWAGDRGAMIAFHMFNTMGMGTWVCLVCLLALDLRMFSRKQDGSIILSLFGLAFITVAACIGFHLFAPGLSSTSIAGSGGQIGAVGVTVLQKHFAPTGVLALLASLVVTGTLLASETPLFGMIWFVLELPFRILNLLLVPFKRRPKATQEPAVEDQKILPLKREEKKPVLEAEDEEFEDDIPEAPRMLKLHTGDEVDEEDEEPMLSQPERKPVSVATVVKEEPKPEIKTEPAPVFTAPPVREPIRVNPPVQAKAIPRPPASTAYSLPDVELLTEPEEFPYELLAKKAQIAAATLEKTFQDFNLNVKVVEIDTGPVITQFELALEAGLRLSKVTALADDLAIALRVPSVRVVAPIPGKNTVGVEVPNEKQVMVRLRELIETSQAEMDKLRVPLFLGKDVSGHPLVVDMTKMPHLLIAGRTGTGKSVCLNTLILSILMSRSPEDVRMLMIDPKMVELSPYKRVPHLMHPVITDMKKAEAVLAWAVDKMEERYDLLARVGVRHLDSYNKLGKEKVLERLDMDPDSPEADDIPEKMPYIVIIADEMADMMMTSGKDVEAHIIRLAQKSRAVGIHLVLATQKPTVDVITGLIKSNLPARISFQVASKTDSRVVLDESGADRLLGNGDMLYLAPGTSNVIRAQGTYVSDEEINEVIDFYSDHEPQYDEEIARVSSAAANNGAPAGNGEMSRRNDDLYNEAVEIVIREGRGSVSLLQRCLGIGYGRAARLVDYMAEDGIVGDYNGSQAREVQLTLEQWHAMNDGGELVDA